MNVSVIIPTYNRVDRLKRVLTALEHQTFPLDNVQVVVVSDGSTDGTHAFLAKVTTSLNLTVAIQENRGVAAARNRGIAEAIGDIALFVDDDVIPNPHLITEHMRSHQEHPDALVVIGPMLSPIDFQMAPWVRWEQAMLVKQYDAMLAGLWHPTARQFYTGNASVARHHLLDIGGFDENFRRAEDVELAYRLAAHGLQFVFNPAAIGYHYAERSFQSWLGIPYAYGRNDVIFARDKNQSWLLQQIPQEYHRRHPLIKILVRSALSRGRYTTSLMLGIRTLLRIISPFRIERANHMLYSALFNMRYYQGVADELGGRPHFLDLL